ncbi:MAG: outer membrane protein, partial [Pseudolabrys sp.]
IDTLNPLTADRGSSATGWTVGGGLEYAFDPHWSAKAEYLYVKFPDKTVTLTGGGYTFQTTFRDSEQIARVGINYRF